jgi:hypothetical protein
MRCTLWQQRLLLLSLPQKATKTTFPASQQVVFSMRNFLDMNILRIYLYCFYGKTARGAAGFHVAVFLAKIESHFPPAGERRTSQSLIHAQIVAEGGFLEY